MWTAAVDNLLYYHQYLSTVKSLLSLLTDDRFWLLTYLLPWPFLCAQAGTAPPLSVSHTLVFIYLNQTYNTWYKKYIRFCEICFFRNFYFADKHNLIFTIWIYCTIGSRWKCVCLCLSDCIFKLKCLTQNPFTW